MHAKQASERKERGKDSLKEEITLSPSLLRWHSEGSEEDDDNREDVTAEHSQLPTGPEMPMVLVTPIQIDHPRRLLFNAVTPLSPRAHEVSCVTSKLRPNKQNRPPWKLRTNGV